MHDLYIAEIYKPGTHLQFGSIFIRLYTAS